MVDIVSHKGVWCQRVQQGWRIRLFHSPHTDQRETLVYPRMLYIPQADYDDPEVQVVDVDQSGTLMEAERLALARELDRKKGRQRAKTKCRHAIKSHGLRQLMTGTYRENMQDFDRAHADFKAFTRLMVKYFPRFVGVWGFERQKRGAWHWHCAIEKLPARVWQKGVKLRSFELVRKLWHRVVGHDNGAVNFDGHIKGTLAKWTSERSLAKIAGYVSKYLTKDMEDGLEGRNMWGRSRRLFVAKVHNIEISENVPFSEVVALAWHLPAGHVVSQHWCSPDGTTWLLYSEPELLLN